MRSKPTVTRLDSGYWLAWWSSEIWAQWPCGRLVRYEDFFHPAWTATSARTRELDHFIESMCKEQAS